MLNDDVEFAKPSSNKLGVRIINGPIVISSYVSNHICGHHVDVIFEASKI